MPLKKQQTVFVDSGLDSDTAKRYKDLGNSDFILNDIVSFIDGKVGGRTNVRGNKLVHTCGPSCKIIGKIADIKRESVIFFIYADGTHSTLNHSIISVSVKDYSITQVLTNQAILNFSLKPITHINIVGDLLFWVDENTPRKINIEKAILYSDGGNDENAYKSITEEVINAAKKPPLRPPVFKNINLLYDTTSNILIQSPVRNTAMALKMAASYTVSVFLESEIDTGSTLAHSATSDITLTVSNVASGSIIKTESSHIKVAREGYKTKIYNQVTFVLDNLASDGVHNFNISINPVALDVNGSPISGATYFQKERLSVVEWGKTIGNIGYVSDSSIKVSNLREKQFRFAYRFLYDDKEKSIFSPFSEVLIPNGEEGVGAFLSGDQSINNRIDFGIETGSEIVKKIEIAVKVGELGSWESYHVIDKTEALMADNTIYRYKFSNERATTPLDNILVNTFSNFSPLNAKTQEYLPTNQIAYGRVKEQFNNVDIDVSLTTKFSPYTYNPAFIGFQTDIRTLTHDKSSTVKWKISYIVITIPTVVQKDTKYSLVIEKANGAVVTVDAMDDWSVIDTGRGYPREMIEELVTKMEGEGINTDVPIEWEWIAPGGQASIKKVPNDSGFNFSPAATAYEIWFPMILEDLVNGDIYYDVNSVSGGIIKLNTATSDKIRTFKHGLYKVGLYYSDAYGRKTFVQTNDEMLLVMDKNNGSGALNEIMSIEYEINHKPPIWATKYQMCVTKNLSETKSLQWSIDSVQKVKRLGITYARIGINRSIVGMREFVPKLTIDPYVFNNTDQLKRIGLYNTTTNKWENIADEKYYDILGVEFDSPKTREEYAYDESTQQFKKRDVNILDSAGDHIYHDNSQKLLIQVDETALGQSVETAFKVGSIIEIVTPASIKSENVFFEIGDVYNIGNPGTDNRYHYGQKTDQSYLPNKISAKGEITEGDFTWKIRYNLFRGVDFPCVDKNVSDFYKSEASSHGKVTVENNEAEQKTYNLIRHSGKYFDNTNINDLNVFKPSDYVSMNDEFGDITSIIQVGDVLKVYQPKKSTSVYIGKSFVKQADGTNQVMTVDRTFGVVNPSDLDYGCVFPESILRNDRNVYFFDVYNGSFLRDAPNGLEPVSRYKMNGYFKKKAKQILKSGIENVKVLTGYDNENDLVFVSFVDSVSPENNETLAFLEGGNRWVSFFSFIPNLYANFGDKFFTTKEDKIYIHNSDDVPRCEFYGVKYPRKFLVYCNQEPQITKTFFSMSLFTNKNGWSAPEIKIDPTVTYPRGMFSRLKSGRFKFKEGVAYSAFMRNMISVNDVQDVTQLAVGDQLRGEVMSVLIEENNDSEVVLYQVDINYINS